MVLQIFVRRREGYDRFKSYGYVKFEVSKEVDLARGWSYHWEGLLPIELPCLVQSAVKCTGSILSVFALDIKPHLA